MHVVDKHVVKIFLQFNNPKVYLSKRYRTGFKTYRIKNDLRLFLNPHQKYSLQPSNHKGSHLMQINYFVMTFFFTIWPPFYVFFKEKQNK